MATVPDMALAAVTLATSVAAKVLDTTLASAATAAKMSTTVVLDTALMLTPLMDGV